MPTLPQVFSGSTLRIGQELLPEWIGKMPCAVAVANAGNYHWLTYDAVFDHSAREFSVRARDSSGGSAHHASGPDDFVCRFFSSINGLKPYTQVGPARARSLPTLVQLNS